jgi:hypothetical protein
MSRSSRYHRLPAHDSRPYLSTSYSHLNVRLPCPSHNFPFLSPALQHVSRSKIITVSLSPHSTPLVPVNTSRLGASSVSSGPCGSLLFKRCTLSVHLLHRFITPCHRNRLRRGLSRNEWSLLSLPFLDTSAVMIDAWIYVLSQPHLSIGPSSLILQPPIPSFEISLISSPSMLALLFCPTSPSPFVDESPISLNDQNLSVPFSLLLSLTSSSTRTLQPSISAVEISMEMIPPR